MAGQQGHWGMPVSKPLEEPIVQEFAANLRGELIRPEDGGYDATRAVFNGMIDKRPAMIARCAGTSDVIRGVDFARTHDLLLSVHGGGHSVAGNAVSDGGLMLDLSPMKGIRVDPVRRTAQAQAGLTLGEFDHETQAFGLATTLGIVSVTGIAGLTLGGGLGWLNGKHGLACDNLISADIVTAEGQLLTASAEENEDLFWGIRGGSGNFGIVTSFKYQLHPVGVVLKGGLLFPESKAREALRFCHEFASTCPMSYPPRPRLAAPRTAALWSASRSATADHLSRENRCCVLCVRLTRRWKTTSSLRLTGRSRERGMRGSRLVGSITGRRVS